MAGTEETIPDCLPKQQSLPIVLAAGQFLTGRDFFGSALTQLQETIAAAREFGPDFVWKLMHDILVKETVEVVIPTKNTSVHENSGYTNLLMDIKH